LAAAEYGDGYDNGEYPEQYAPEYGDRQQEEYTPDYSPEM
jgi:hypothetical protein